MIVVTIAKWAENQMTLVIFDTLHDECALRFRIRYLSATNNDSIGWLVGQHFQITIIRPNKFQSRHFSIVYCLFMFELLSQATKYLSIDVKLSPHHMPFNTSVSIGIRKAENAKYVVERSILWWKNREIHQKNATVIRCNHSPSHLLIVMHIFRKLHWICICKGNKNIVSMVIKNFLSKLNQAFQITTIIGLTIWKGSRSIITDDRYRYKRPKNPLFR